MTMAIIRFFISRQVPIGLLLAAFLFMPWKLRKDRIVLRLLIGVVLYGISAELIRRYGMYFQIKMLLYTALTAVLIRLNFQCSVIHSIFSTTCAYAVQLSTSKLAYMIEMPILLRMKEMDLRFVFGVLFTVTAAVWLLVFFVYTRPYGKKEELEFDNGQIVIWSGLFILAAIGLSVSVERGLDRSAENYLSSYLAVNTLCILFSSAILTLEIINYNTKALERENLILASLLKADKQQYEQAQKDMEKINIRYHDLKQQYSKADEAEKTRLEEEMAELSLSYFTGNRAVDITLTQKSLLCQNAGIRLICSVDGNSLRGMKQFHIYSMLGNALDNAMECLEQISDEEKKEITLDIHREKDMAIIRMENYTPREPVRSGQSIVTSKADRINHGYGIRSIQNTAELYGGTASTFVDDHIFYLVITLPIRGEKLAERV
ncbi:MAG: ATP-binding protein [Lachnospiraceae bacterium]|nr:ATP-binding protein [Lachnospiraceae bacterium]